MTTWTTSEPSARSRVRKVTAHTGTRRTLRAWLPVTDYCAEEVGRQYAYDWKARDAAKAVGYMIDAWSYALLAEQSGRPIGVSLIEEIGSIVEPKHNRRGFREIPIFVGNQQKSPPDQIVRRLLMVVDAYNNGRLDPGRKEAATSEDELYYQFEEIHPFRDGNGRTGKIIYNMASGTLLKPKWPPDFYGGIINP